MAGMQRRFGFPRRVRAAVVAAGAGVAGACVPGVLAGGSPENVLVVINPGSAESQYLGNYYKTARNIPDANVLYIDPSAATYAAFNAPGGPVEAFLGQLVNAGIDDHIDYVVIADGSTFHVAAPGLVNDLCAPVMRFSISSAFTMAHIRQQVMAGGLQVGLTNQYASTGAPQAFNSRTAWINGLPNTNPAARRYFVAAQLGYTGERGNTIAEILTMIDRSVQSDGTRPAGTFYFMSTTDGARNVRSPQFPAASASIISNGGQAASLSGVLPDGMHDCLGVLTGWPDPPVEGSNFTMLPGAFGDHLTSYAATFDVPAQVKTSSWVRKGASGSSGTVEEPCNYTGKFVHSNFHAIYWQGMSLGEAWLRSMLYTPFQSLLVGDPMARPFARLPAVSATVPGGTASGVVQFTPVVGTPIPGAVIASVDLYVDGVFHSRVLAGEPFSLNTLAYPDGHHELRVLATDNTNIRNVGRWIGSIESGNAGRWASASPEAVSGDMSTLFTVNAGAGGGPVKEVRLLHNGRVIAASATVPAALRAYGRNIGAGQSRVQVESLFADGRTARSAPVTLNIAYAAAAPSGLAPVAYSYTKVVTPGTACAIELPARFDDAFSGATYTVLSGPAGAALGPETRGYRVITVPGAACGPDQMTFRVQTPSGTSNVATVSLVYAHRYACAADIDGDGLATVADFTAYLQTFALGQIRADMDGSCSLNVADFTAYLQTFARGCP